MQKWNFALWRGSFSLACVLYALGWLVGIMMTIAFAPQQALQNLQITPGQTHDAWYYISHNVGIEGVLLLGACTFGRGTGLVLCLNGLFDGMIVTAIARHYGPGVLPIVSLFVEPRGESILASASSFLTLGNVDDHTPAPPMVKTLRGKLFE